MKSRSPWPFIYALSRIKLPWLFCNSCGEMSDTYKNRRLVKGSSVSLGRVGRVVSMNLLTCIATLQRSRCERTPLRSGEEWILTHNSVKSAQLESNTLTPGRILSMSASNLLKICKCAYSLLFFSFLFFSFLVFRGRGNRALGFKTIHRQSIELRFLAGAANDLRTSSCAA